MVEGELRSKFSELFGKVIHFIIIIAIVIIIVLAVIFMVNVWRTGAASGLVDEGLIALDETGDPMKKGVFGFWNIFWNPSEISNQFKWESEVVEYESAVELGVDILKFETNQKFLSNEPIQVTGLVKGASINDEGMNLRFLCELDDYEGESLAMPSEIEVHGKGVTRNQEVSCFFSDGIEVSKQQDSKKVTLKAEYDFLTQSTYRLYFMDSLILDSFLSHGLDPFINNQYNVQDDLLLKPTNVMRSQITEGPIDLRISSETSQPFSQSSNFVMLNVDLVTKESGNLKGGQ